MRGIGDEALLGLEVLFQPRHQFVEGAHHRLQLFRHPPEVDRRQDRRAGALPIVSRRRFSGARPLDRPSQTRITARGMMANCGSSTPEMMREASAWRFLRVSATWIDHPGLVRLQLVQLVGNANRFAGEQLVTIANLLEHGLVVARRYRDVLVARQ